MEVMRILNALQVKPRRTIRIGLWTGEEQGLFGSAGYVKQHFGYAPLSTAPEELEKPEWMRKAGGPVVLKPEQPKISGYFNVDNGTGKILGIYLQENAAVGPIFSQWIEPLKDLGVTTITDAQYGRHRSRVVRRGRSPGLPVHSGSPRLRYAHASLEHGHV